MQCKDTIIHVSIETSSSVKGGGIVLLCIVGWSPEVKNPAFQWNSSLLGTMVLKTYSNFLLHSSIGKLTWQSIREFEWPAWNHTVTKWEGQDLNSIPAFFPLRLWESQGDKLMGYALYNGFGKLSAAISFKNSDFHSRS